MNNLHRGFIAPLVLAIIALILVGGGAYVYTQTKPANQSELGIDTLLNSQYVYATTSTEAVPSEKFINGRTEVLDEAGELSWSEIDAEHIAFEDLNNDGLKDAAVIITHILDASKNGGNGGSDQYLNVVFAQDKSLFVPANVWIGSAIYNAINSVTIENGVISVDISDERFSEPSRKIIKYRLKENQLVNESGSTNIDAGTEQG